MLHAWKLSLPHPKNGEVMNFTSPLPDDFRKIKELLTD
jgi:23S rRNA-/tRNA-specific pseudouridylate synthase